MLKRFLIVLLVLLAAAGPLLATVSQIVLRFNYSGNGVTTVFSVPHIFYANADVKVILKDNASSAESLQTLTSQYTVTGAGASVGGSVTMLAAPATGKTLIIYLDPDRTQTLDLAEGEAFSLEELEKRFDRITIMVQRLDDLSKRSLRLTDGNYQVFDMTLPVTITANSVITANATANGWQLSTLSATAADLSALSGGGNTALHFHSADRDRANHTGVQLASTISDFTAATEAVATATPTANKIPKADGAGKLAFAWLTGAVPTTRLINTTGGISGGASLTGDLTLTISDGALALAKLANITTNDAHPVFLGRDIGADGPVGELKLDPTNFSIASGILAISGGITGAIITNGSITGADLAAGTVALSNMSDLVAGQILARGSDQGNGPPQALTIGAGLSSAGGILSSSGGAATWTGKAAGVNVGGGTFNTLNVGTAFFASEGPANVFNLFIATSGVTGSAILDRTITASDITLDTITANEIAVDGVGASEIAADAVGSSEIAADAVGSSELASGIVGSAGAELADSATNNTAATDFTFTPKGNAFKLPANKYYHLAGQAGDPTGFSVGGIGYDTTKKSFRLNTDAGPMSATGTITSTITDSGSITAAAATDFDQQQVFPANTLTAGKAYRVIYTIVYNSSGSPTVQARLKLKPTGAASILADTGTGNGVAAGATGRIIRIAAEFTVRSIGAGGTAVCGMDYRSNTSNTVAFGSNGAVALDTTVAQSLILEWTWSAVSNTAKIQSLIIEQLN